MKHIVQLVSEKNNCTEYAVFEAAALALCKANHKTVAHMWWTRHAQAKRTTPHDPLQGVSPEVINYLIDDYYPRGTFPQTSRRLLNAAITEK